MSFSDSVDVSAPAELETARTSDGLKRLIRDANLQYSLKNYDGASEIYSQAAELQSELNGELAPENGDLLYLYGRCLFQVGLAKSDLLGGQLTGAGNQTAAVEKQLKEQARSAAQSLALHMNREDDDSDDSGDGEGEGDDEDSEDDDEAMDGAGDEDEFAVAHDILEIARLCYEHESKELASKTSADDMAVNTKSPDASKAIQRLADIHDLLAEIALENEEFSQAADEFRSTLELRKRMNAFGSGLIAEAHFKLALALEFAFGSAVNDAKLAHNEAGSAASAHPAVDTKLLYEAMENVAIAIQSCNTRIAAEQAGLASLAGEAAATKKREIQNVQDMVQELRVKLADVGSTAKSATSNTDLSAHLSDSSLAELGKAQSLVPAAAMDVASSESCFDRQQAVSGTAAQKPGETAQARQERINQAAAQANDLSGLVRHKKKSLDTNGNGKRKADYDHDDDRRAIREQNQDATSARISDGNGTRAKRIKPDT